MARISSSIAVPPAASPIGLPKNSVPAMVARLAVCPAASAVELASGLYAASCGFMAAKTVAACVATGAFLSICTANPYSDAKPFKAAFTLAAELSLLDSVDTSCSACAVLSA